MQVFDEKQTHPAWIEVDASQFRKNLASIRRLSQAGLLCLPIKANAYGHGLIEIARIAEEEGVDYLGVSCLQEALFVRKALIDLPILVFGAIHEMQIPELIEWGFEFTISSLFKAKLVEDACTQLKKRCRVHIKVDTGMQRTGVRPESSASLIAFLEKSPFIEIVGIYSHLATADTPQDRNTEQQIRLFRELKEHYRDRGWIWHLANSGGVLYYPESHFDMIRPGLLCYGYAPSQKWVEVDPCFSLRARVSYFKVVGKGQGISYGHHYRTAVMSRVVTVPIGYGDGYRRSLYKKAQVLIGGRRFQISGAICMDQFMVDVGKAEVFVGDEVTLLGKQGEAEITLEELSLWGDSIPHEILSAFTERLPRHLLE